MERLCPLGLWRRWCQWAQRSAFRTRHRVPRERCNLKLLPSKQRVLVQCWYPRLWGWASHLVSWARLGDRPSVHQQWCPPWRPSPLWGTWTRAEYRGTPSRPSLLYASGRPLFSAERCRGIHPSICSFNRSHGLYPGVRRAKLSVAECRPPDAACSSVVAVGLTTGRWAELSFASAGRGADPDPDRGPGAGHPVAGSMEQPESDESNLLALHLPAVAVGASRKPKSPPSRAALTPTGLVSGSFAIAFILRGSLVFSPFLLRYPVSPVAKRPVTARLDWPLKRPVTPRRSFYRKSTATSESGFQCLLLWKSPINNQ
jgi:hypothetical protein